MKKSRIEIIDNIVVPLLALLVVPVIMCYGVADIGLAGQVEIRKFKKQEHLDTLISAFHFDLAPNETLYVENFERGWLQAELRLGNIAIEGIISVDDFISRYKSDIIEVDVAEYPETLKNRPNAFRACIVDLQIDGYYRNLIFYQTEKGITARLDVEEYAWRKLVDVESILFENFPRAYLHPIFLIPASIEAVFILYVVVRVIYIQIHKPHHKKHLNEQ